MARQQGAADKEFSGEWLVADATVEHLATLLEGLSPGVAVSLVEQGNDPAAVLSNLLACPSLRRLHLLGHGSPGELLLAGERFTAARFASILSPIRRTEELQICFWSCHTGQGEQGRVLLQEVADMTGATVFAADGAVGHPDKGGSWQLNVSARPARLTTKDARSGPIPKPPHT